MGAETLKVDDFFYIQDARADLYHSNASKNDFVGLSGTEKYPVKMMGEIDSLNTNLDIFGASSPLLPVDEITLELIMFQRHSYGLPEVGRPYYMQFLFYDFDRVTHLFLLNARIIKISCIPRISHTGNRHALTIISARRSNVRAAYETYETKHDIEWKNGGFFV